MSALSIVFAAPAVAPPDAETKAAAEKLKLGVRNEARGINAAIHTAEFDIDEAVLPLAVRAMATLVWDYPARSTAP